jgi:hypothetical protein
MVRVRAHGRAERRGECLNSPAFASPK